MIPVQIQVQIQARAPMQVQIKIRFGSRSDPGLDSGPDPPKLKRLTSVVCIQTASAKLMTRNHHVQWYLASLRK
jgi:hypothetical protein